MGGRSLNRSIIHNCVVCRRHEGQPLHAPPPPPLPAPPLPAFRVNEAPPFSYTGVDYAGPLFVHARGVGDDNSSKVWICLFTCCVTRAVHLELVSDMFAPTFVRCLKRFAARRGLPKKFVSDNGKAFHAAAKTLKDIANQPDLRAYLTNFCIEWTFNLEKAPWWGGIFERLVKSVKKCLRKIIGQAKFSYGELNTALVEVEAIVNSSPLTYVSFDNLEEPLTPSHLLVGRGLLSLPDDLCYTEDSDDEEFTTSGDTLQKRARHLNNVINHFWSRWVKEYLLELRNAHRYPNTRGQPSPVQEGDVVVVQDTDLPRGFWKIARVMKLLTGKDGQHRGAVLRVAARGGQATTLQRPLQLLYPLEIHGSFGKDDHTPGKSDVPNLPIDEDERTSSADDTSTHDFEQDNLTSPDTSEESNSRRTSVLRAQDRVKQWSKELLNDD